jgi:RNA polymerase sigma-70 factor, ECF subfamily
MSATFALVSPLLLGRAPARRGRARSRHNARVNSFSNLEIQTPSEASGLAALIVRMAQGEAQAMAELYDATVSRVYSFVRRFAPDDASAQDVTQDVYLQAWQQAQRFDSGRGVAMAWLLNLARSRALDAWRKASSSPVLINSDVADVAASDLADTRQPLDFLEATDNKNALHIAMQQLPAATRQMLSLAFFHDMSHAEISAHLSTPLGTVKSTVRRALLSLREHLQYIGLSAPQLAALDIEETP